LSQYWWWRNSQTSIHGVFGLDHHDCCYRIYNYFDPGQLRALVFFPALLMGITFFEAWDKTCIINAYFGIKNLGQKNQRERDFNSLKIQRTQSAKIILKGIITAVVTTVITYFV